MEVPSTDVGLALFYEARIKEEGDRQVMALRIDDLPLSDRVSLARIDVEGHEVHVVEGMRSLIRRSQPVLIIENSGPAIRELLVEMGYRCTRLPGSPNLLCRPDLGQPGT